MLHYICRIGTLQKSGSRAARAEALAMAKPINRQSRLAAERRQFANQTRNAEGKGEGEENVESSANAPRLLKGNLQYR